MKKSFLPAFLLLFLALGMFSCQQGAKETTKEYPMFWTWLDYRPGMNFDSICQVMNDIGMDGIMLNAPTPDDYRAAIPVAHKHGIEVYAWLWTMNLEHDRDKILKEHPEWFSVNRNGKSLADTTAYVGYYKFLCPALPEVREFIKEKIKAYCEVEGLNGIAIDYHRFVDVVLPTTLWPHYGIVQDREYAAWDYGYHPEMLRLFKEQYGYDPRESTSNPDLIRLLSNVAFAQQENYTSCFSHTFAQSIVVAPNVLHERIYFLAQRPQRMPCGCFCFRKNYQ